MENKVFEEENFLTKNKDILPDGNFKCDFCSTGKDKYKCPKCNVLYCSLTCYKSEKHLECSELFYRDLVQKELKDMSATADSKNDMIKILKRMDDLNYNEEASQSDTDNEVEDDDLSERLQGIDMNDTDSVWEHLSEKEQNEFMVMIKSGKTADVIPKWNPWWRASVSVEEVKTDEDQSHTAFMDICPPVFQTPLLSTILTVEPSSCIPFNILNVLTGYAWITNLFNGDHHDNCVDASEALFSLCPVLSKGVNYKTATTAVVATKIESQNYPWLTESEEYQQKVQIDVRKILTGPNSTFRSFYVMAALSDIRTLLVSCRRSLAPKEKCKPVGVFASTTGIQNSSIPLHFATKESMGKCIKKIEFFLSYVKEYPDKVCRT